MKQGCTWCLAADHLIADCPKVAQLRVVTDHGIVDPMLSDEVNDQLALRLFRERAAKGAYRKLCLDAGLAIPAEVLDLDADSHLYAT